MDLPVYTVSPTFLNQLCRKVFPVEFATEAALLIKFIVFGKWGIFPLKHPFYREVTRIAAFSLDFMNFPF